MMKFFLPLLLAASLVAQEMPDQKIAVQNAILAKINGNTISMMDVKKKMDVLFHANYPQLVASNPARFQFYQVSWRPVMMELIDHELILADSSAKEVKITDGEVREEMENRFGPNVMFTLDSIGLTYDEALKMVKNDLIVQRMTWWFVQSKAMETVTPENIRQAYRLYLKENPAYEEYTYRILSLRADEAVATEIYQALSQSQEPLDQAFEAIKEKAPMQLSAEYVAKDIDLSDAHRAILTHLEPGHYHKPQLLGRDQKYRIFYLVEKTDHPAPSFESLSSTLRQKLIQKGIERESQKYLAKLRIHYGFDAAHLKEVVPTDFQPFSLE